MTHVCFLSSSKCISKLEVSVSLKLCWEKFTEKKSQLTMDISFFGLFFFLITVLKDAPRIIW